MSKENFQEEIKNIMDDYFPPKRTVEENKLLCSKYPFLTWYGDPLYLGYTEDKPDYSYSWEDEIPTGWRKAFCPMMWDELKEILEKGNYLNEFRFVQIKEKYGTLCLYTGSVPNGISDDVFAWVEKYEKLSERVCIDCGAPATRMTLGWINFVCDDCSKHRHEIYIERIKKYPDSQADVWTSIPIKDIDEYYKDRKVYFDVHKFDKKY